MGNFFRNIHPLLRRDKRKDEYDDTNFSVLNALNYELTQAEQETIASKIQSSLESATGEYLDTWGDWFGVYRKDGWDDEYYRGRIIRYLLLKRSTIPAIIDALVDFLEDNDAHIEIYEPWKNIFYTNKSKLNGEDHMMGYYYRFAIIDISIDRPFPPEIIEVIKAFKPAGVLFYVRLDMSKNPSTTPVQYPFAFVDVSNKTELDIMNGLTYDINGNMNLTDQVEQVVTNDIFHTNRSLLNGTDVLAGSFTHGRGYLHLASTITLEDYTPKPEDSMTEVKLALGESNPDFYLQTKDTDGRTATVKVPRESKFMAWANSSDGVTDFNTLEPNENILPTSKLVGLDGWTNSPYQAISYADNELTITKSVVTASRTFYNCTIARTAEQLKEIYSASVEVFIDPSVQALAGSTLFIRGRTASNGVRDAKISDLNNYDRGKWVRVELNTITIPDDCVPEKGLEYSIAFAQGMLGTVKLRKPKLEIGRRTTGYTTTVMEDKEHSVAQYIGYSTLDSKNPTDYTWIYYKDAPEMETTKAYSVFDVKSFIDSKYAIEFAMLRNKLGEEEALNRLFNEFDVSTSLKALLPPSDGLHTQIQIYDFQANLWHDLITTTLDLNMQTFNLPVNQVTSYLNDHGLMFIRYVFEAKETKEVSVELDMLNILFNYRMGSGYSMGLQSSVVSWQDFPVNSITLNKTSLDLAIASKEKLTATILPETATNKKIEWVSSNPTIATVDDTGTVTGVAEGQTEVVAYGDNREVETRCAVNVYKPVTSIEATPAEVNLTI